MIVFILITIIFVTTSFSFPTTVDHDANHPDLRTVPISTELKDELDSNFWRELGVKVVNDHISRETNNQIAKNIIFFLGDGMSVNTITAARSYIDKSMNVPLSFEKFPYTGMAKNYCIDKQTADSACSTTAYLCGVKAKFETIGVNGNVSKKNCTEAQMRENQTPSIAKWALDVGKDVGFVTTTSVTDASPVGLYGHTTERDWENDSDVIKDGCDPEKTPDIAKQLIRGEVGSKLKVIMGGGRREFRPKTVEDEEIFGAFGRRTGEVDLIEEWKTSKGNKGHYIWNKKQLTEINPNTTDYLLGLFDYGGMKYNLEVIAEGEERLQPSLHEMTAKAIDILSRDPEGFFLFVEGGLIDNAHHDTHATIAVDETVEMAKAVQIALDKVNLTETLIVVTADHAHTMSFTGYAVRKFIFFYFMPLP